MGHLPRDEAAEFRRQAEARGLFGRPVECDALITGGWRRARRDGTVDEGSFGVKLDL